MKQIFKLVLLLLATLNFTLSTIQAQAPQKMTYQAVVRDASNNLITNTQVGIEINILQSSVTGMIVYTETKTPTTNNNGLLTIEFGGQTGFDTITWANGPYFLETKIDPNNSGTYTITGTSQLLTVPYALYAKTAESISGNINENDPIYSAWNKSYNDLINKPNIIDTVSEVLDTTTQFIRTEIDGSITNEIQNLAQVSAINNSVNTQLKDVNNPTDDNDAATKIYVDQMMQIMENNGLTVVDFSSNNQIMTINNPIIFTDNSAINPTSWNWDFGDGNTSTTQNPTHIYTTAGTYSVSLTASNGVLNKTETKIDYITIFEGVTDIDGSFYNVVTIGTQVWMKENLRVTHYPNGDPIPHITDNTTWGNLADDNTSDAYCYFNNDSAGYANSYGAIYSYAAAIGDNWTRDNNSNQGVCPDGWHLPTEAEWTTLSTYLGGTSVAGGKMKEAGTTHWNSPNTGADNSSDFTALPSGYRHLTNGSFNDLHNYGYWWSNHENSTQAWYVNPRFNSTELLSNPNGKSGGFAIRCIKD